MLTIKKGDEPRALAGAKLRLRSTPDTRVCYDNLTAKEKAPLLDALLRDQGYICAYCMRRMHREDDGRADKENAHVEQILPRHPSDALRKSMPTKSTYDADEASLDYGNMLAVCSGGEVSSEKARVCDKARSVDKMLVANPLNNHQMDTIRYGSDGTVYSSDDQIDEDLNYQLNLNTDAFSLKENRKKVIASVDDWVSKLSGKHESRRNACMRYAKSLRSWREQDKDANPFLGVILWRLAYWERRFS